MAAESLPSATADSNRLGAHGYGVERGSFNNKPVNAVPPTFGRPSKEEPRDEKDGVIRQETMPPKSTLRPEDLYLRDLLPEGSTLAFKVAQMLNRDNNRIIRNWRHLAESLEVPGDVCLSFMCDQEHSPTEDLFDYLGTWKPYMTIGDLKKSLRSMSRNDLVQYLDSEGIPNNSKICDHQHIVDVFKEKLDTQLSRTLSWTQLATKLKIPKKTYTKFGKPKLGPTSQLFLYIRLNDSFKNLTVRELRKHIKSMDRFDVVRVLEQNEAKDNSLVKDLFKADSQILEETSELLDKDLRATKNWRHLAVRLGIPGHIYEDFDSSKGNDKNPTMLLLKWLEVSQSYLKAVEFIQHLKGIHRNDVVEELNIAMSAALERKIQTQNAMEEQSVVTCEGSTFQGASVVSDSSCSNHSANLSCLKVVHPRDLVIELPFEIYSKVCARLDVEDPFFHDYRMLAEKLGVSNDQIRILGQRTPKPTHSLLNNYKIKINQFMEILKDIKREDLMEIIEPWVKKESSKFSSENTKQSDSVD